MKTKTKTKILFVVPGFSLGGTTTALASMLNCKFADDYDIDVFAITRRDYNLQPIVSHDIGLNGLTTAYYGDFSRFQTKEKVKYLFVKLLKQIQGCSEKLEHWVTKTTIKKIERKKHYDVVVGFQELLATRFTSRFKCPRKIAWIHCDYASTYGEELDELDLYSRFEKVVCVSQFTRQGFVSRYPSLADKTVAIHNIFDAESVVERSKAPIDDPRFDTSCFTIVSLGRVHDVKRFYLIPEIAAQLKKAGLNFRWYILGSADIPDELKRLSDAVHQYSVENEVVFLGGKYNPYPYLKAANLMVTISKSEACPMIFNEAKILHLPILSADFGSAFEFVEQGKDGFITTIEQMPQQIIEIAEGKISTCQEKDKEYFLDWNEKILSQLKCLFSK